MSTSPIFSGSASSLRTRSTSPIFSGSAVAVRTSSPSPIFRGEASFVPIPLNPYLPLKQLDARTYGEYTEGSDVLIVDRFRGHSETTRYLWDDTVATIIQIGGGTRNSGDGVTIRLYGGDGSGGGNGGDIISRPGTGGVDGATIIQTPDGTEAWRFDLDGDLVCGVDNTYNIGKGGTSPDLRPYKVYVGTEVIVGDTITIGTNTITCSSGLTIDVDPTDAVVIDGGLEVTGDAAIDSDLNVSGDAVVDGDLNVSGETSLSDLVVGSYLNVGSTTDASGTGDFSSGLTGAARMFYDQSNATLDLFSAANARVARFSNNLRLTSTGDLVWSSTADAAGTTDAGIVRQAANALRVTNGGAGGGALNVGATTVAAANGDFAAGDGTRTMDYDASAGQLSLTGGSAGSAGSSLLVGTAATAPGGGTDFYGAIVASDGANGIFQWQPNFGFCRIRTDQDPGTSNITGNAVLQIGRRIAGTPVAGFGAQVQYTLKTSGTGSNENGNAGQFIWYWTNPDHFNVDSNFEFRPASNGTATVATTIRGDDLSMRIAGGLEVGASSGTISGAGDVVAGDGTREIRLDVSQPVIAVRDDPTVAISANNSLFIDCSQASTNASIRIRRSNTAVNNAGTLTIQRARNTSASPQAVQNGDVLGQFGTQGYGDSGFRASTLIESVARATFTNSSAPGSILLKTCNTGQTTPVERWQIQPAGHFIAGADNSYDIGASGATRPRNAFIGTALNVGSGFTVATGAGDFKAGDGTRELLFDASTGIMTLDDSSVMGSGAKVRLFGSSGEVAVSPLADGTIKNGFGMQACGDPGGGVVGDGIKLQAGLEDGNGNCPAVGTLTWINRQVTFGSHYVDAYISIYRNSTITELFRVGNSTVPAGAARIEHSAHQVFMTDDTYDIGSSDGGTTDLRPRRVYVGTEVVVGDTITIGTDEIICSTDLTLTPGGTGATVVVAGDLEVTGSIIGGATVVIDVDEHSASITLARKEAQYIGLNTGGTAGFTITLPVSPMESDRIWFKDQTGNASVNNVFIDDNGKPIDGALTAGGFLINFNFQSLMLMFANGEWRIF